MPKFSANLSMLYTEHAFLDRFAAAADDGFKGVEYLSPYEETPENLAKALSNNGLQQVLFNLPSGDWAGGERGIGGLPGREAEFSAGVDTAITYCKELGCAQVNCLAGIAIKGREAECESALVENLKMAADKLGAADIRLLLEPINSRDIPSFLVTGTKQYLEISEKVGSPNLWLQYDLYHMQIMQGDLIRTFEELQDRIAHVQCADNPGRNEPGSGEINYPYLFKNLDRLGYAGWVGAEYKPKSSTSAGLGWFKGEQS